MFKKRASGKSQKKKFEISGILRDKFAEKKANFAEKRSVKNGRFRESFPSKFRLEAIGLFEESFQ